MQEATLPVLTERIIFFKHTVEALVKNVFVHVEWHKN